MNRKYRLNPLPLKNFGPKQILDIAKELYKQRFPDASGPFSHCLIYLVIEQDKTLRMDFNYPQDTGLTMSFIHKRPRGGRVGEAITNSDLREITNIHIPKYKNKYYFDFIFFVLDITTQEYWGTNLWTQKVCPDIRFYLSAKRKLLYKKIGKNLAKKYNTTTFLGHVNLKSSKLKQSSGILRLCNHGWIPTISILPQPYGEMIRRIEKDNSMDDVNKFCCEVFEKHNFLEKILERWKMASLTINRHEILETSIKSFLDKDYISTIFTLIPQIEGLVTKHIKRKGHQPKEQINERFKQFGDIIKAEDYNTTMTKYLNNIFVRYVKKTFFRTWYPYIKKGKKYKGSRYAPQRNILLHGEIKKEYFSEENCIKIIHIIDNIILLSLTKNELNNKKI